MKYARFVIFGFAVVSLAYVYFTQSSNQQKSANVSSFETKTDEQGLVSIRITPQTLSGAQWKFDIVLDTHSVELDQDFTQIAVLADDQGNEYKPVAWEGAGPGGHHREGILRFMPILPKPKSITLKILQVDGIEERNFTWQLQ